MKVLISRPDKIGDVILALHGAKQLKKLRPELQLYMHVSEYTRKLVEMLNFLDGVLPFDAPFEPEKFDVVVDLMAKNRTAQRYKSRKIALRIGNSARWFSFLYNKTRFIRRSHALINEAEYNWQLISLVCPGLKHQPLSESLNLDDFNGIVDWNGPANAMAIMPGVTVSAVGWSKANWMELARTVAQERPIVIILGPAEKDQVDQYKSELSDLNNCEVVSPPGFAELLGILKRVELYVGPSTGVTHMAAIAGCQGVALYPEQRSMHPNRWQPFNSQLKVMSLDSKPSPQEVAAVALGKSALPDRLNPLRRSEVSGFVVCFNEENNIRRCLESLKWCDEIVVVDSGSTDKTVEIVKEYTDKIFIRPWEGHRQQKQFALNQCTKDWVVNIDSDEEISIELRGQIIKQLVEDLEKPLKTNGFMLCRLVHFLDHWWEKGGWYPEYRMRFFRRKNTKWGGVNPHEKALVTGKIRKLTGDLYHYTYKGFHDQIESLNCHSSNAAHYLYASGKRCRLHNIVVNPCFRFFKFYFMKRGILEGIAGFIVAVNEALYTFLKYAKLWELHQAQMKKEAKANKPFCKEPENQKDSSRDFAEALNKVA